jgi:glutamate racemase
VNAANTMMPARPNSVGASLHLLVTDSGLGGLAICAELERRLRLGGTGGSVRLTYVNAWPEGGGYNSLPDVATRVRVFDRALQAMERYAPDRLLIACNTLSILYPETRFSRAAGMPVDGIVDAGVELFAQALEAEPDASLVILGTKTTVESGVHLDRLIERGVDSRRIASIACHGLATAIEIDPFGVAVGDLLESHLAPLATTALPGRILFAGLCCSHYGYVAGRIVEALQRRSGRPARTLDPNARFVDRFAPVPEATTADGADTEISVEVISKVELSEVGRRSVSQLIMPVSAATARALLGYTHAPDLF